MKIENAKLLNEYRTPGECELCGEYAKIREPHHLRTKGFGGGAVLDIRINLIALGGTVRLKEGRRLFSCRCHHLAQQYKIPAAHVLAVVAMREKVRHEEITEVVDWMRRLIRPTESELRRGLAELSAGALALAVRELTEAGRLSV